MLMGDVLLCVTGLQTISKIGLAQPGKIMRGVTADNCERHLHQLHVCAPSKRGKHACLCSAAFGRCGDRLSQWQGQLLLVCHLELQQSIVWHYMGTVEWASIQCIGVSIRRLYCTPDTALKTVAHAQPRCLCSSQSFQMVFSVAVAQLVAVLLCCLLQARRGCCIV